MTDTLSTKPLTSLTAELWDFLGLGPDLDLPALEHVVLDRFAHNSNWTCSAFTQTRDAAVAIDAVNTWATYGGSQVRLMAPYKSSIQPSGWQVSLSTTIVVAEVQIGIHANLDADRYAEAMAEDAYGRTPQGLAAAAFAAEAAEPVRVTGAFADFLLGEDVTA